MINDATPITTQEAGPHGEFSNGRHKISLFSAVNLVVASMIGAGVYTTSGYTLADLGSPQRVLLAWAIGGVIALCGAISYGALAGHFRQSGGEYLFLSRAIHPALGYVGGFVSILAGFTGSTAIAATAFESYFPPLPFFADWPDGTIAAGVIAIGALLHGVQARWGTQMQDALVVLKYLLLLTFFVVSFKSYPDAWQGLETSSTSNAFPWTAFAVSLMWISLSYSGFNAAIYVTSEIRDAETNVPRALWIGTALVTVLYLLLNAVFVLAPDADLIRGQQEIGAIAARVVGGASFETLFRAVLLASLATSVSAMMMSGPRVTAQMAMDGILPSRLNFQKDAPKLAVAMQAIMAIVVVYVSSLKQLLSYLGFTLSLCAAMSVGAIFWLRHRGVPIKVPFYPWPPMIFVAATCMVSTIAAFRQPIECMVGIGTFTVGILVYWAHPRRVVDDVT